MKKLLLLFALGLASIFTYSQNQTFDYQGISIGHVLPPGDSAYFLDGTMMPEVIKKGNEYIMYFTVQRPGGTGISFAGSNDLIHWDVRDSIFQGSPDTSGREYIMGGQSVVRLNNGQYRMFYRCAPNHTSGQPKYHIRSAISSDGIHFTREGVNIDIDYFQPNSFFQLVGQSAMYRNANGTLSALLTAKDTTMNVSQPPTIYYASSTDEGVTWGNFTPLYANGHDPVVVKDSTGTYRAYFTYLNTGFKAVSSPDGINWPATPDTLYMKKNGVTLDENNFPRLADLGAVVDTAGNIIMFSNFADTIGDWSVAYFYDVTLPNSVVSAVETDMFLSPNPAADFLTIHIQGSTGVAETSYRILNLEGKTVYSGQWKSSNPSVDVQSLHGGLYLILLETEHPSLKRFIKL